MCPECHDTRTVEIVVPDFTWVREDEGFDSSQYFTEPCPQCAVEDQSEDEEAAPGWTPETAELTPSDEEPCPF